MKTMTFKFPNRNRFVNFVSFCEEFTIKILSTWTTDSFWDDKIYWCIVKIDSQDIPAELKQEKIREKYQDFVAPKENEED